MAGLEKVRSDGGAKEPVISQGCGQNLLRVLRGQTSAFVQESGASRWDTCAAEALLQAVGGKVTTLDGTRYSYTQGTASYVNTEGLIAARTEALHSNVFPHFVGVDGEPVAKRAKF